MGDRTWKQIQGPKRTETPSPAYTLDNPVPLSKAEQLAANLIVALDTSGSSSQGLQQMGSHFRQLPSRLGHSRALDAALDCFLYSFTGMSEGQPRPRSSQLTRYCSAISHLRQELTCSDATTTPISASSETIAASLLLAQYEIFRPGPTCSYVTLSGGLTAILKACGPDRVASSEFELAIFTTQYPTIITQCLVRGEECFLTEPGWKNAMRSSNGYEHPIVMELWTAVAEIPGVLEIKKSFLKELSWSAPQNDEFANNLLGLDPKSKVYNDLLSRIYHTRSAIVSHSDAITHLLSTPGVHAICPSIYRGPHPVPSVVEQASKATQRSQSLDIATRAVKISTFYHSCVILINTILQDCLPTPNSALLRQTDQSTTYILQQMPVAVKPWGAFFMTLAGPLCYGVLDSQQGKEKDKESLLNDMHGIFEGIGIFYTHEMMLRVFVALTRGGWQKNTQMGLKERQMD